jgi:hypothetical protein
MAAAGALGAAALARFPLLGFGIVVNEYQSTLFN